MANPGDGIGSLPRNAALTISHWIGGVSDQVYDYFPFMGLLKRMNRVKRVKGGGEVRWILTAKYPELETMSLSPGTFQPTGGIHNASVPWASYVVREPVYPAEKAENEGDAAKAPLISTVTDRLQAAIPQRLAGQFWLDGNATGNSLRLQGLESFMGITPGDQVASDEFATTLADTYGGKSTAYGALAQIAGATQTSTDLGTWAHSPVVVNCNRTPSGGSLLSWENNCESYLSRGIRRATWGQSMDDQPTAVVLRELSHAQLLDRMRNTHRVMLGDSYLTTKYGFRPAGTFNFEGAACYWDRSIPATDANSDVVHGYALNPSKMELRVQSSGVSNAVRSKGEADLFDFWKGQDPYTLADYYALMARMQLVFKSVRHFAKFAEISA